MMTKTSWSTYQEDIFKEVKGGGEVTVAANPGSGKTTSALEIVKRQRRQTKLLVAFNKSIATELKSRTEWIPFTDASTLHSLGLKTIRENVGGVNLYNNKIWEVTKKLNVGWGLKKDWKKVTVQLSYMWQCWRVHMCRTVEEFKVAADSMGIYWDMELLAKMFEVQNHWNDNPSMIDYTDMIYLPVAMNMTPHEKYDLLIIDEAQDLSLCQHKLIQKFKGGQTVAVGDRNQAIYAFAGANNKAFELFANKSTELPLSITYRCPLAVIEHANKLYDVIVPREGATEGEVRSGTIEEIEEGDFVLCRNNAPLMDLYFYLIERRKRCYIRGSDIGNGILTLINSIKFSSISELVRILKTQLEQLETKLSDKGIASPKKHPSYGSLLEQVLVIKSICDHVYSRQELVKFVKEVFVDSTGVDKIMLSSIHKAKGLEADNIFILNRDLIPSKYAETEEQLKQEKNLLFVAITRAKNKLIYIEN